MWRLHIGRPGNLLHVVNNLAAWHFSCRRHYNDAWIAETGPLTDHERVALDAYRELVSRGYGYGDRWLGRAFVPADREADAWHDARGRLGMGAGDEAVLRRALAAFRPRFARLWAADRPRLTRLAVRLDGALRAGGVTRAVAALER